MKPEYLLARYEKNASTSLKSRLTLREHFARKKNVEGEQADIHERWADSSNYYAVKLFYSAFDKTFDSS